MSQDIVSRLRGFVPVPIIGNPELQVQGIGVCLEAANEIARLRHLMKVFVSAWERSELGENNGTEYFNAVHAMRMELKNK